MNRGLLALAGGLVLVALVVLYIVLGSGDATEGQPAARGPKITEADSGKADSRLRPIGPSEPAPSETPPGTIRSGSAARDYVIGGVRVRDHRAGDHAQLSIPPVIHPPHGRRIPSQLTHALTQRLRPVVNECAANVPLEGRGAKPGIDGEIMIAIKNQQATVTSAMFQLRDVAVSDASVKECLEQKAVGISAPSGDEAEVENYGIMLSLRLP